jgi:spore coat protein U-like protein
MANVAVPGAYLNYALFRDAARTQTWRDTGNQWIGGTGTGAAQSYTVYGELPGGQVVSMGPYVDTVTATVRN